MSDDRLDALDYYTLLRIEPDASADGIRRAFHQFALAYHPDRFAGAPEAKQERAGQIYRRGAEAYRVLMDPAQRRAYDEQLANGKLRLEPADAPAERPGARSQLPGALEVRSIRARPFLQKALEAQRKSDLRAARLNFQLALQHEPDNAALKARLAEVEAQLGLKR